jgi:hypothetical protein
MLLTEYLYQDYTNACYQYRLPKNTCDSIVNENIIHNQRSYTPAQSQCDTVRSLQTLDIAVHSVKLTHSSKSGFSVMFHLTL